MKTFYASNEQKIWVVFDIYGIMHLGVEYMSLLQRHLNKISLRKRNKVKTSFLADIEIGELKWSGWRAIDVIGMDFRLGKIQKKHIV